jgi:hypothetical protein
LLDAAFHRNEIRTEAVARVRQRHVDDVLGSSGDGDPWVKAIFLPSSSFGLAN